MATWFYATLMTLHHTITNAYALCLKIFRFYILNNAAKMNRFI